jgi:hypothetical protein
MFTRSILLTSVILAASFANAGQPGQPGSAQGSQPAQPPAPQVKAGQAVQQSVIAAQVSSAIQPPTSTWVYFNGGAVARMNQNGFATGIVMFGLATSVPNTCLWYGTQLVFDATTVQGKMMYTLLLTAKATGKAVDVYYYQSSTPGTDQTNGCTTSTMAVVTDVGFPN